MVQLCKLRARISRISRDMNNNGGRNIALQQGDTNQRGTFCCVRDIESLVRLMPPPFSSSELACLAKMMPLAAALTIVEFSTAPELLNWSTNDFTCSSNSLP